MTYTFRPAVRENAPLLLGLAGGTGSGKTYSALRIARGLVEDGKKIALIDTENGRGLMYADDFPEPYLYAALAPPFTPERYIEAMKAAEEAGAKCIIVDSASHEWEGVGGLLEQANEIAAKMAAKANRSPAEYTFPAWREPKQAHQRWVSYMLQCPAHLILCFRAKEKYEIARGQGGRSEIVNKGWTPITESGLPYEMLFLAVLTAEKPGLPEFSYKALTHKLAHVFQPGQVLSEDVGRALAAWAAGSGGAGEKRDLAAEGAAAADGGMAALQRWWNDLSRANKVQVKPQMEALKKRAAEADAAATDDDPFPAAGDSGEPPDAGMPEGAPDEPGQGAAGNDAASGRAAPPSGDLIPNEWRLWLEDAEQQLARQRAAASIDKVAEERAAEAHEAPQPVRDALRRLVLAAHERAQEKV